MDERRHFTRIIYSSPAKLHFADNNWNVDLLDLSLKGALISKPKNVDFDQDHIYHLEFQLSGSDLNIVMSVNISHIDNHHLGLKCHHIDIDSVTHLRRMIELNVGDDTVLNRELENLTHSK